MTALHRLRLDLLGRDFPKRMRRVQRKGQEYLAPISDAIYNRYYSDIAAAQARTDVTFDDGIPVLEQALKNGEISRRHERRADLHAGTQPVQLRRRRKQNGCGLHHAAEPLRRAVYVCEYRLLYRPGTLFHEFGHYYNFYLMGETL